MGGGRAGGVCASLWGKSGSWERAGVSESREERELGRLEVGVVMGE